MMNLMLLISVV